MGVLADEGGGVEPIPTKAIYVVFLTIPFPH
jgi:hypothetical protein